MKSTSQQTTWHGIALVIAGAFCFSLAIPLIRWTDGLGAPTIAFFRAVFGFIFLSTLVIKFREPIHFAAYRDALVPLLALSVMVSLTVISYTYAVRHTTAANSALLVNSAPIYVAVLAPWVLKESRGRYTWLSLGLALVGAICIAVSSTAQETNATEKFQSNEWSGIAAAALSGLAYAMVMLISRSLRGRVMGLTQNLWSTGILALLLVPWAAQSSGDAMLSNLPLLVPAGAVSLGLSYLLYFLGLARLRAQSVSVVSLIESVFGILMGIIFFTEIPNEAGWIGGFLILFSIYLISR